MVGFQRIEVRSNWYVRTKISPQIGATYQVVSVIQLWKKFWIYGVLQDDIFWRSLVILRSV